MLVQHMLPCRPAGSALDVKKSKHKKMAKWLNSYGKSHGLLAVRGCNDDCSIPLSGIRCGLEHGVSISICISAPAVSRVLMHMTLTRMLLEGRMR